MANTSQNYVSNSPRDIAHDIYSIPIQRSDGHGLRNRASSIFSNPIGSFKGTKSLSRFASSFNRAQSFKNIETDSFQPRSYFKDEDVLFDRRTLGPSNRGERLSKVLPRGELSSFNYQQRPLLYGDEEGDVDYEAVDDSSYRTPSIYSYGAIDNHFTDYQEPNTLKVRNIESKGKILTVIAGQSTSPQTIFNSVNVLIGIGLLALPLGLKHSGWIIGVPALTLCALLTYRAAGLLSLCMDTDPTLMTYSDLAFVAFGPRGRAFISVLFSLDLLASGVALIVLFADSLNAIFPEIPINHFKILAFLVLTPPSFLPLNILSFISLFGIASTIGVVLTILVSGFLKSDSPGSLLQFMPTNLWPETIADALIAIGVLMAPFGGHSIFPNLKVDMRHPHKFKDCLQVTYLITYATDLSMAIIGFLMFGGAVKEEITKSVLLTEGYPSWIYIAICGLTAIVPFSKTPLNARPIISILDVLFGTDDLSKDKGNWLLVKKVIKISNRLLVNTAFALIAIVFPEFDKIIAFVGSGLCFLLCLILPSLFYLIICKNSVTSIEKIECWAVILVSAILSIVGTAAAVIF
ncbi:hypothetical protein WICMUC_000543 [Wickerhamomyces mucosus]|uniref:Amino acid transporter transmembrane domain-containing protein n=1 Tax=Wickerhamomyces mucosus TaxID=1378264 RepID=A0A9P8PYX5_9ASCO|nr:hypothetical protein WICMUC_000543 [Wickerhamomyces mucosus]